MPFASTSTIISTYAIAADSIHNVNIVATISTLQAVLLFDFVVDIEAYY